MSILIVNHTAAISGAEVSLLDLIDGLAADHRVTVASPEGPLAARTRELGAATEVIPAVEGSLRLHPRQTPSAIAAIGGAAMAIRRVARRVGADVVHANSSRSGLAAAVAGRLGAPRPVVHLHDCLPPTPAARVTDQVLSHGAALVLANSAYTRACFNGGRSHVPVEVVHNPIDLDRFDPGRVDRSSARAWLNVEPDDFVLTVLGQITPWKGQDTAIEAVGALRGDGHAARLLVAGDVKFRRPLTRYDNDAFLRRLHERVHSLSLEATVTFTGECFDVPRLLRAADCVLVPSWAEPWGRVVVEAMAMETPVIATNVGGTLELIEDGRNGLLAPPRRPEAWARAVGRLIDDADLRARIVAAGRETARRFDRQSYVDRVAALYRRAVRRADGRSRRLHGGS